MAERSILALLAPRGGGRIAVDAVVDPAVDPAVGTPRRHKPTISHPSANCGLAVLPTSLRHIEVGP
jgi:hypothetical protein